MIAAGPLLHSAPMMLSESQKKYLRGLGHSLKPVVMVGDSGLTEAVLSEFNSCLEHHELIKVRVKVGDREERDRIITKLCDSGQAELVQRIGNMALLYRENPEKKRIRLPH
jgi:RNA-binding protein